MKKILTIFMILFVVLMATACQPQKHEVTINDADKTVQIVVGQSKTIVPILTNEKDVLTWSSSNNNVATVSAGTITAVGVGTATITVTIEGTSVSATITVTVINAQATEVKITGARNINVGETLTLSASVLPTTALQSVVWTSDNVAVATVSSSGVVTGVSAGDVNITATAQGTTISKTVQITVLQLEPATVVVSGSATLLVGANATYSAVVGPTGVNQTVVWSVDNSSVATIDAATGVLTALSDGAVVITATSSTHSSVKGTLTVTITRPEPETVVISGSDTAVIGTNLTLSATVNPNHALQSVTWSVDNSSIATIDAATGVLTPLASGTVVVTATSIAKNTVQATKTITVTKPSPTSITINGSGFALAGGATITLSAIVNPSGVSQTVTWSVDKPLVATIDASTGVLTPLTSGTVVVTATSTEKDTVKATKTIIVYNNLSYIVDDSLKSLTVGDVVKVGSNNYYFGYTAFATLSDLNGKLANGTYVDIKAGTYSTHLTVDKNDVQIKGNGTITGIITVVSGVSGLTIDGLNFTKAGQVLIDLKGNVSNFTFTNNHVYDTTASMSMIYFKNDGTEKNSNFVINDNIFEVINATTLATRYIRGGNIENITIIGNKFKGIMGQYTDGIRLEGSNDLATAGIGAAGEIIIQKNTFETIGQRSIWLTRYSATLVNISDNSFDQSGDQTYGGGVQIQTWVSGQTTQIILLRNIIKNIGGNFGFRINNDTLTASSTWSVEAHYNSFIDFHDLAPYDDYIQAYSEAAKGLINADYNLFLKNGVAIVPPAADRMPYVGSYNHCFNSLAELEEAIMFDLINSSDASLLIVGTHPKVTKTTYETLAAAYAASKAGDTILLLPGLHNGDLTIAKNNLSLISLNSNLAVDNVARHDEAIITGKITLAKELKNLTINGLKFTGNASIVNTVGTAGTASATTINLKDFYFIYNIVETNLASGKGFIYFVEAASCYSHNLHFEYNSFKTTNSSSTLEAVVYIDNVANLYVVGNIFKDIKGHAFHVFDTTKGLSGEEVLVVSNLFENVTGSAFKATWMSPLPGQIGKVRVVNNVFKNIGDYGVYFGNMNNTDRYSEISILYNSFYSIKNGVYFNRVHGDANIHVNYNKFYNVPTVAYATDGKDVGTAAPVAMDVTKNLFMSEGLVITPSADKFVGSPNYANAYTSEEQVPVYLGEGEIIMNTLQINALPGKLYINDTVQLTYSFTPEGATATTVTWKSSDITIATVSATGLITGLKTGTVTITATSVDNPTLVATLEIQVYEFESIELRHPDNGVIKVGETVTLGVSVFPNTITDTITYTSKTPSVATVSSSGQVTGVSEGLVVIEASIGSRIVATITVVVKNDSVIANDPLQFIIDANLGNSLMKNVTTFGNTNKTEFVYGAVSKIWFGNLQTIEALAPVGNSRPGTKLTSLEFITVHDTGNNNKGANGLMHRNYLINNDPGVSWHYVVDSQYAYHQVPNNEVAYHAGDGSRLYGLNDTGVLATSPKPVITISPDGYYVLNGTKSTVLAPKKDDGSILQTKDITPSGLFTTIGTNNNYYINNTYYNATYKVIANQGGNRNSIGIESCVDEGSDLYATWQNLAKLVASLLVDNNLGLDRVMQHNNWSGKNCPQTLRMANLWDYFMEMVTFEYHLRKTYSAYTFTFTSNNPTIINNTGKIISKPRVTTEVSYTVRVTGPSGYDKSITLYAVIPGTKIVG